jgi:hypothetical protein
MRPDTHIPAESGAISSVPKARKLDIVHISAAKATRGKHIALAYFERSCPVIRSLYVILSLCFVFIGFHLRLNDILLLLYRHQHLFLNIKEDECSRTKKNKQYAEIRPYQKDKMVKRIFVICAK